MPAPSYALNNTTKDFLQSQDTRDSMVEDAMSADVVEEGRVVVVPIGSYLSILSG
jgi:hypothetical protein